MMNVRKVVELYGIVSASMEGLARVLASIHTLEMGSREED
jgi:hypothetical protein